MMKRMLTRTVVLLGLAAVASPGLFAQAPVGIAFEVASIRKPESRVPASMTVTGTRVDIRNYPLYSVVLLAFKAEPFQISVPEWLREPSLTDGRFDIQAVIPAGATREQVPEMLRTLLTQRFGLVSHVESRPVPAYDLVVSEQGMKMREVEPIDELTKDFPAEPGRRVTSDLTDNEQRVIRMLTVTRYIPARTLFETELLGQGRWQLDATRITTTEFARVLGDYADRPVFDKTGLTGVYQFKLALPTPASTTRVAASIGLTKDVNGNPINLNPSGITVFKAVESLGLRLEPRQSPIDVTVIDQIGRIPTQN